MHGDPMDNPGGRQTYWYRNISNPALPQQTPEGDPIAYIETDVIATGGPRGSMRLVFGTDGSIYYTDTHYEGFTNLLYEPNAPNLIAQSQFDARVIEASEAQDEGGGDDGQE
jgi:hypothetical protein